MKYAGTMKPDDGQDFVTGPTRPLRIDVLQLAADHHADQQSGSDIADIPGAYDGAIAQHRDRSPIAKTSCRRCEI